MATQQVDSPPAQRTEGAPEPEQQAQQQPPRQPGSLACAKCGAALAPGQDWCLQCGTGAPGSVGSSGRGPLVAVLVATVVLVLGAAGAGYAALSKKERKAPVVVATVPSPAAVPAPTTSTPTPTTTTPATPLPTIAKPPKIPLKAATPLPGATTPTPTTPKITPTKETKPSSSSQGNSGGSNSESKQEALVLDTNAASTYDPYAYPATWFGDPSLAIDGDPTTGWTAQVNPSSLPNMAEGLLLDLKSAFRLSSVKLITGTPGMTVQVYGTQAKTPPTSITDPAWAPLSRSIVVKKRTARIGLRNRKKAYRFITLWISRAPASVAGTPEAPGKVSVDELELFPPAD